MRPQRTKIINGAEAMATAYQLAGVRIAYTFPITPQSEVMDYFASQEEITCIQADSEYNVLAGAEGVLWSGERCAVATASQGLIFMSEVMWEVAGNRLPMVMGVFNRGLKGPGWCLGAQQNDSLFMRDIGWLQFYCESAQEILDFILIAFRLAEEILLPVMVIGDGFYLSHEREEVVLPTNEDAQAFIGQPDLGNLPRIGNSASYGGLVPAGRYFQFYRKLYKDVERVKKVFPKIAREYGQLFGRTYDLIHTFLTEDAETILVTSGTISGTAYDVVEERRQRGEKVGLVKIHAFRPFPNELLQNLATGAEKIIVLDRNIAPGLGGIFASEVKLALCKNNMANPVYNFITGLGGLDVTPEMIELALDYVARSDKPSGGTLFLTESGIEE